MISGKNAGACALAFTWILTGGAAHADTSWLGSSAFGWEQRAGFFVTPNVAGGIQQLGRWNSTVTTQTASTSITKAGPLSEVPQLHGVEPGGTIGYVFRDGTLPPMFGERVRIGVTGSFISYKQEKSNSGLAAGSESITQLHVTGQIATAYGTGAGFSILETLRVQRQGFDGSFRIASDFTLMPGLTLTPSVAFVGGRAIDKYEYLHTGTSGAVFVGYGLHERVRTTSFGADFGAGLTWQPTSFLALNVTGHVGPVWQRSHLDAQSSCSTAVFICFGPTAASTSSSRSVIGIRTGGSIGAALDMRFAILTLGGYLTYDSKTPGVQNPASATLIIAGSGGAPARIHFDGRFGYGGFATVRVPLIWM
jgi:hypothetical protein